jgi:hypothetical protein
VFKARGQNSHEGHKGPERPQGAKKGTCHNSHKGLKGSKVAYMFTVNADAIFPCFGPHFYVREARARVAKQGPGRTQQLPAMHSIGCNTQLPQGGRSSI